MDLPREIVIGAPGGDYASIRVEKDGDGWLGAEIEVRCDGWIGRAKTSFHKGELRRFGQEIHRLHRKLSGTARLDPLEPKLKLSLTGDGKGHILVEGVAQNNYEALTRLNFRFEIDQTYLDQIAQALGEVDPSI